jgi:hypothetical protein
MRLTLPRLLALVAPLAVLSGCGTTRPCSSDTEYLQAVERQPIQLPPEITPTERMQPMAIPPVDPNPSQLDPQPRCLDQPPKFFARKAAAAAPAAAGAGAAAGAAAPAGAADAADPAVEAVQLWAWAWASGKTDTVVQMYSPEFQATGQGGSAAFLEQRRQQVQTGRSPEPKLEDVTVTESGADRRVVRFVQRFGEGGVRKEMTLVLEGGLWRIVAERTLEVL